jgi:PIN domain nuclease of toxin-antitoxin system
VKAVLDTWAVAALLNDEPAAEHVSKLLERHDCWMSSINLGEAYYVTMRRRGQQVASHLIGELQQVVSLDHPDWPLVRGAAEIKAQGGLSYADAFCVATARRHGAPLYTGDEEIIRLAGPDLDVVDLRTTA